MVSLFSSYSSIFSKSKFKVLLSNWVVVVTLTILYKLPIKSVLNILSIPVKGLYPVFFGLQHHAILEAEIDLSDGLLLFAERISILLVTTVGF